MLSKYEATSGTPSGVVRTEKSNVSSSPSGGLLVKGGSRSSFAFFSSSATAELEKKAKEERLPPFTSSPPLGLDDTLDFSVRTTPEGVPLVASYFDNMTGATVGLALRLDRVSDQDLVFLSIFP